MRTLPGEILLDFNLSDKTLLAEFPFRTGGTQD